MKSMIRNKILVVGAKPPPYNGMSIVCENILSSRLVDEYELIHLDTADRRGLANVGTFDFQNVFLSFSHGLKFLWLLLSKKPAIVYIPIAQNLLGYLRDCLFILPSKFFRRKIILHLHGSDFGRFYQESPAIVQSLIRFSLSSVSRVIVLGGKLRTIFTSLVPVDKVVSIPNGIPFQQYNARNANNISDVYTIVYLGTLVKAKGFLELIMSIPQVVKVRRDVRFIIAGEHYASAEIQEAQNFIHHNGLENFVTLPGVFTGQAKIDLLQSADIFVFPPIAPEGQPLVILEAMAAGLPVISTDQGCIADTVIDGQTGFIVPAGDPQAIAEKVLLLIKDTTLSRQMGEEARKRYEQYYTLEVWVNNLNELFREVLTKP